MTFLALWCVLPREQIWEDFVSCHMKTYGSVFQKYLIYINKSENNQLSICSVLIKIYFRKEGTLAELHIDSGNPYLTLGPLCYLSKSFTLFWSHNLTKLLVQ